MWTTGKFTCAHKKNIDCCQVAKDLTFEIPGYVKSTFVKLYSYLGDYMLVPRFYPKTSTCKFTFNSQINYIAPDLFSHNQRVVFAHMQEIYQKPAGRVLIMQTGQGKTFMGLKMIEYLRAKTLIVTHNREIAYTWYKLLQPCDGDVKKRVKLPGDIGFYGDGTRNKANITVGIVHTLVKEKAAWFADFDFIIYDEITEFVSPTRRNIFELAARPYILALTATPDIQMKFVFELHAGPYLVAEHVPGYNKLEIPWKVSTQIIKYYGPKSHTQQIKSKMGTTQVILMDKQFADDMQRNDMIIGKIRWLVSLGKNVFVFYSICELGQKLHELYGGEDSAILTGKYKSHEMQEILNSKNVVFTTYKFSAKGISIVKMDAIILVTPQISNTEQVIGRILRIGGDYTRERLIIDIVDQSTSLRSQFYERKKFYEREKFNMSCEKFIAN